ncbi:glycosyltransferase family 4 protein [Tianweitania sp.]|uniref:glycosyltransferase family 4 protein n=1 Tax=Tianweitania sp. TaxID=2021634 RepID=UPI00289C3048|nr:glycosyltransferase family 4 protein [Tianweitania sp.]
MTIKEDGEPIRILFVFAWLVVGGEETEIRLLARTLDPARYRIDVVACFRKDGMPEQTHRQLEALGVDVDTVPYDLSFDDTVWYLAHKVPNYDIVVSSQNVADIYPALEILDHRPPLIEHGGLVSEALAGPKHFTSRYVGVCQSIRDAAASKMPDRPDHALEIPSMVDLVEFDDVTPAPLRAQFGVSKGAPLIGWVGRLDAKKRVEDFIEAAALVHKTHPAARFVVVGGPDAFMPDYAERLHRRSHELGLDGVLHFLGDRDDIPAVLASLDIFTWLSRGEGMPHVIAEAGAAGLPVIATADNGSMQQIEDGVSGIFVGHENPAEVAAAMRRLIDNPALRKALGSALQHKVRSTYSTLAVIPQWQALFDAVLAERVPAPKPTIFRSFLQGGFECSTHRRGDHERTRLDLTAMTGHADNVANDYRQLAEHRIRTVRDGLRWHLIETSPGHYDWSSFLPMLRAARDTGTQVIWDLLHYGWPDDLDVWTPAFIDRFARFSRAAARVVKDETGEVPFYCPVNEPSFFSWGGGDVAYLNPFARGRGFELKAQMVRASVASMREVLDVEPRARFVHCDPAINVLPRGPWSHDRRDAQGWHQSQYQSWDMIAGRSWPQLGGEERFLDIVGVNYYFDNQWVHAVGPIDEHDPRYKRFRRVLTEVYSRYGRPIIVAETGTEGDRRASWMRMILHETQKAREAGVPVEGICLYPVVNHVGWDDGRNCPSGLLSLEIAGGRRQPHQPLAEVLAASTLG